MKKEEFLNLFSEEDKELVLSLYNKYSVSLRAQSQIFTNEFYPSKIWRKLKDNESKLGINVDAFGGFDEFDRCIIAFNWDNYSNFPCDILKIVSKSKFEKIEHRDYLGALMALGLKREKFGDLIISDGIGYVATFCDISPFIVSNLDSIGKSPCNVETLYDLDFLPKVQFKESVKIASSMRLDCIVSSITGISRSEAERCIKQGAVLVNYNVIKSKDKNIGISDIISIRKYGKFKIGKEFSQTAKGRIKFILMKYT